MDEDSFAAHVFRDHPAILLSYGYVYISALGVFSDSVFFGQFRIQIVEFYSVPDLLFAGLRSWVPLVLGLVPFLYVVICSQLLRAITDPRSVRARRFLFWSALGVAFVVLPAFTAFYALESAHDFKTEAGHSIHVSLSPHASAIHNFNSPNELRLIGKSQGYVFLYDSAESKAWIVPVDQVLLIDMP